MRKAIFFSALLLLTSITVSKAQSNSIKGCVVAFIADVHSGSTLASSNYQNCISQVPPGGGSSGNGAGGGPEQTTPEGPPTVSPVDNVLFSFSEILDRSMIIYLSSPSQQIVEFESMFAESLNIIRTINITGLSPDEALHAYLTYIINNNLASMFYNIAGSVAHPNFQLDVLYHYANNGNSILPPSWSALGYTLD